MMKCPEDIEVKAVMKKGRLRVQFWSSELGSDVYFWIWLVMTRSLIGNRGVLLSSHKRWS